MLGDMGLVSRGGTPGENRLDTDGEKRGVNAAFQDPIWGTGGMAGSVNLSASGGGVYFLRKSYILYSHNDLTC